MNDDNIISVAQLSEFARLVKGVKFKSNNKEDVYEWVGKTLGKFRYFGETKRNKGIIKNYIMQMTGYSGGNVDKLIARKKDSEKVFLKERTQNTLLFLNTKINGEKTEISYHKAFKMIFDRGSEITHEKLDEKTIFELTKKPVDKEKSRAFGSAHPILLLG